MPSLSPAQTCTSDNWTKLLFAAVEGSAKIAEGGMLGSRVVPGGNDSQDDDG